MNTTSTIKSLFAFALLLTSIAHAEEITCDSSDKVQVLYYYFYTDFKLNGNFKHSSCVFIIGKGAFSGDEYLSMV
jgi:hypothetical protein